MADLDSWMIDPNAQLSSNSAEDYEKWRKLCATQLKEKLKNNVKKRQDKFEEVINAAAVKAARDAELNLNKMVSSPPKFIISQTITREATTRMCEEIDRWPGVHLSQCKKMPPRFKKYWRIADNWWNRQKGKFFGDLFFQPILQYSLPHYVKKLLANQENTMHKDYLYFVFLYDIIVSKISFKKARPNPLIFDLALEKSPKLQKWFTAAGHQHGVPWEVSSTKTKNSVKDYVVWWVRMVRDKKHTQFIAYCNGAISPDVICSSQMNKLESDSTSRYSHSYSHSHSQSYSSNGSQHNNNDTSNTDNSRKKKPLLKKRKKPSKKKASNSPPDDDIISVDEPENDHDQDADVEAEDEESPDYDPTINRTPKIAKMRARRRSAASTAMDVNEETRANSHKDYLRLREECNALKQQVARQQARQLEMEKQIVQMSQRHHYVPSMSSIHSAWSATDANATHSSHASLSYPQPVPATPDMYDLQFQAQLQQQLQHSYQHAPPPPPPYVPAPHFAATVQSQEEQKQQAIYAEISGAANDMDAYSAFINQPEFLPPPTSYSLARAHKSDMISNGAPLPPPLTTDAGKERRQSFHDVLAMKKQFQQIKQESAAYAPHSAQANHDDVSHHSHPSFSTGGASTHTTHTLTTETQTTHTTQPYTYSKRQSTPASTAMATTPGSEASARTFFSAHNNPPHYNYTGDHQKVMWQNNPNPVNNLPPLTIYNHYHHAPHVYTHYHPYARVSSLNKHGNHNSNNKPEVYSNDSENSNNYPREHDAKMTENDHASGLPPPVIPPVQQSLTQHPQIPLSPLPTPSNHSPSRAHAINNLLPPPQSSRRTSMVSSHTHASHASHNSYASHPSHHSQVSGTITPPPIQLMFDDDTSQNLQQTMSNMIQSVFNDSNHNLHHVSNSNSNNAVADDGNNDSGQQEHANDHDSNLNNLLNDNNFIPLDADMMDMPFPNPLYDFVNSSQSQNRIFGGMSVSMTGSGNGNAMSMSNSFQD